MQITLFIPGLTGPAASYSSEFLPVVPALDRLLARGAHRVTGDKSPQSVLARLFDCAPPTGHDVPVAAVTHTIDAAGIGRGIWMRADPVHLRADRHGAVLMDASVLGIDTREALALAAEIKPLLEDAGLHLEVPCTDRWYLRLESMPDLHTTELTRVAGRSISMAMPWGNDAVRWLRLLNEIQVVLHQSPVNGERTARGLPAVNSLWFWGIGATPTPDPRRFSRIHGTDLFLRGLVELGGNVCLPVPADGTGCLAAGNDAGDTLVMLESCARPAAYQEVEAWAAAVADLERCWFVPLLAACAARRIGRLTVVADGFEVAVHRRDLLCLWRRRGKLARLAPGVAGSGA